MAYDGSHPPADFKVTDCGSVWTFEPVSEAAKDYSNDSLEIEGWQWVGPAFAVNHRTAQHLIDHLTDEGFVLS